MLLKLAVAILAHFPANISMMKKILQLVGKFPRIMFLYQKPRLAVSDDARNTTLCCRNTSQMMLHSLKQNQREALVMIKCGKDKNIGSIPIFILLLAILATMGKTDILQMIFLETYRSVSLAS